MNEQIQVSHLNQLQQLSKQFSAPTPLDQNLQDSSIKSFQIADKTIYHIPGTARCSLQIPLGTNMLQERNEKSVFSSPELPQTLTWLQLVNHITPGIAKAKRQKIIPPEPALSIGLSGRRKICRLVQLYYQQPDITEQTLLYTEYFKYLADQVKSDRSFTQEFSACRWAIGDYSGAAIPLATAFLIDYGDAQDWDNWPHWGTSLFRLQKEEDGVLIQIGRPHSIQVRVDTVCQRVISEYFQNERLYGEKIAKLNYENYEAMLMSGVYFFDGWYYSPSAGTYSQIYPAVKTWLSLFLSSPSQIPPFSLSPNLSDLLSPQEYFLPYSSFSFPISSQYTSSAATSINIEALAARRTKDSAISKLLLLTEDKLTYTRKELEAVGFTGPTLDTSIKRQLITRVKKGHFTINWEQISLPKGAI